MSSDLSSQTSIDLAAHGPSCPAPSPYDSSADDCNDCGCVASKGCDTSSHWSMSSDPSSRNSDDITGPTCPAPSPYNSNTDDDDEAVMVVRHEHSGLLALIMHLESPMI